MGGTGKRSNKKYGQFILTGQKGECVTQVRSVIAEPAGQKRLGQQSPGIFREAAVDPDNGCFRAFYFCCNWPIVYSRVTVCVETSVCPGWLESGSAVLPIASEVFVVSSDFATSCGSIGSGKSDIASLYVGITVGTVIPAPLPFLGYFTVTVVPLQVWPFVICKLGGKCRIAPNRQLPVRGWIKSRIR